MTYTRRKALGTLTAASAALAQAQRPSRKVWNPKLGILARFTEANLAFAKQEGFTSLQLSAEKATLDPNMTDEQLEKVKATILSFGLYVSSLGATQNHIQTDPEQRSRSNAAFAKVIELAGRLGVQHVATASGTIPGRPLAEQVDEIVRVYTEKYFPVCEKHNVKILWEPWAGGPNIATGPVGFEALFKAFNNSPHVGLQYDPSHLVWQFMDPIQCARDFVDKIYDVHLKDTEIFWPILRKVGIHPLNNQRWWRFRLPGFGLVDWKALFTVLMDAGYQGAMNIEHEDELYYPPYSGAEFTEQFKAGYRIAHRFLRQLVPELS
jgi:sugar phosphate isomerase/epimerase